MVVAVNATERSPPHDGQPSATQTGERRQVTALFYDIVGSTAALSRFDPEDVGWIQRLVHAQAVAAIDRHGGYVVRLLGDGGCAYFGYPVAAEDAAPSAVAAGFDLIERCKSIDRRTLPDLTVEIRVGIATGVVVLKPNPGTSEREEIVGLAPNLAARLQSEAGPNEIVVADTTFQLSKGSFTFEELGSRELKGFKTPQRLWRPTGRRSHEDRFSSLRSLEAVFVAREAELALCRGYLADAEGGNGQLVVIRGEPGIGKSRLVAELRRGHRLTGDVRVFQCQPRGETRPLHPLLDTLRRDLSIGSDAADPAAIRTYLRRAAPGVQAETVETLSFLLRDDLNTTGSATAPNPELRAQAVRSAMDLISSWARPRFQMVIFEDVHWADSLTESLIQELSSVIRPLPVLMLVTSRQRVPLAAGGAGHVHEIALKRLEESAIPKLVEAVWRPPPSPPDGLAAFIKEHSDGIPLFAEELTRLLRDRIGAAPSRAEDWRRILQAEGVVTLQDFITARLAGLGEGKRFAQVASVIGREFDFGLLARMTEGETSAGELEASLAKLTASGLIRQASSPAGPSYRFRHVLIQEAAYNNLLKTDRRDLHDRIVRLVLADAYPRLPDATMSWHCEQAGRLQEAAQFAIAAAEDCAVRSAMHEAESLLVRAEDLLAQRAETPETQELTLQMLMTRGTVAAALYGSGSPQARSVYERGVRLCRARGVDDLERWFPLYWGWWFTSPDFAAQRDRSQIVIRDLAQTSDPEVRLQALHCSWATDFDSGAHSSCLKRIRAGLALYDATRAKASRIRYGGHDAKVCGLGEQGQSLWFLGREREAVSSMRECLVWARRTEHLGSLCHALDNAVLLRLYQRRPRSVATLARLLSAIADRQDLVGIRAKGRIFGGWAQALLGNVIEGLRTLEEGLDLHGQVGTQEDSAIYSEMNAELLPLVGRAEEGLAIVGAAIERAEAVGPTFWLTELFRRRAALRLAVGGTPAEAAADLEQAVRVAEGQGAVALAVRARADLARLSA
jgi:predicted ATPase/class 3 adenylate cyclase